MYIGLRILIVVFPFLPTAFRSVKFRHSCPESLRAVPEIILRGRPAGHLFVLWGGRGVLLIMCPRGGGGEVTCPGDQGVFDP